MYISTEHILQCNQSEPLADTSGRIVDLMNENGCDADATQFDATKQFLFQPPSKPETLTQCQFKVGLPSTMSSHY